MTRFDDTYNERLNETIQGHKHPYSIVITENDQAYGSYTKLVCRDCPAETYVRHHMSQIQGSTS